MKKRLILVFLILLAGFVYAQDCNNVLNPISIPSSGTSLNGHPSIAWNGNEYGIIWKSPRVGSQYIYFARFDSNGGQKGSAFRISSFTSYTEGASFLTTEGNKFSISWTRYLDASNNLELYFLTNTCVLENAK